MRIVLKILVFVSAFGGLSRTTQAGEPLLGVWDCRSHSLLETVNARVLFEPNGSYHADMTIRIDTGGDVLVADADYFARYHVEDNLLSETPEQVIIKRVEANGEVVEGHALESRIVSELMKVGDPVRIVFSEDGNRVHIIGNRSTINCIRK